MRFPSIHRFIYFSWSEVSIDSPIYLFQLERGFHRFTDLFISVGAKFPSIHRFIHFSWSEVSIDSPIYFSWSEVSIDSPIYLFQLERSFHRFTDLFISVGARFPSIHRFIYFSWSEVSIDSPIYLFQLERSFQRFTTFYSSQHSGRKLNWLYHMSKGELVTNCFKNRYTLQVTAFLFDVILNQ